MSQSKRMDKPRCRNKCHGTPFPFSVRTTENYDYVTMQCGCGYTYITTSQSAFRLAVAAGLARYGNTRLNRRVLFSIRFNIDGIDGDFQSMYAAQEWLTKSGYTYGSSGRGSDPVAIRIGKYDLQQKWHNISDEDRKTVDGIMYYNRTGPALIYLFNISDNSILKILTNA